jgi:hypothetical protein
MAENSIRLASSHDEHEVEHDRSFVVEESASGVTRHGAFSAV